MTPVIRLECPNDSLVHWLERTSAWCCPTEHLKGRLAHYLKNRKKCRFYLFIEISNSLSHSVNMRLFTHEVRLLCHTTGSFFKPTFLKFLGLSDFPKTQTGRSFLRKIDQNDLPINNGFNFSALGQFRHNMTMYRSFDFLPAWQSFLSIVSDSSGINF